MLAYIYLQEISRELKQKVAHERAKRYQFALQHGTPHPKDVEKYVRNLDTDKITKLQLLNMYKKERVKNPAAYSRTLMNYIQPYVGEKAKRKMEMDEIRKELFKRRMERKSTQQTQQPIEKTDKQIQKTDKGKTIKQFQPYTGTPSYFDFEKGKIVRVGNGTEKQQTQQQKQATSKQSKSFKQLVDNARKEIEKQKSEINRKEKLSKAGKIGKVAGALAAAGALGYGIGSIGQ